jgi:hypothetical protein
MQWAFGIRRKISAALLLAAVFVLIFLKNMVDNHYVTELGDSFSSVYEDRLVVSGYIYRLSTELFNQKIMIDTTRTVQAALAARTKFASRNDAIDGLIAEYARTKLTDDEAKAFDAFKSNVTRLRELEHAWLARIEEGQPLSSLEPSLSREFEEASGNLSRLSVIQVSEGRILNDHSRKIVSGSTLLAHFELGILIAIALMVLVLALESSAFLTKPGRDRLN